MSFERPRRAVLAVVITGCIAVSLTAQTWSGSADFDATQNPNGPWTYGWSSGGVFTAHTSIAPFCGPLSGWGNTPGVIKNTSAATACCTTVRVPPGRLVLHPGPGGEKAVLRWTAPATATYAVQVLMGGLDFSYPTSTVVEVALNGQVLFSDSVNSYGGPANCSDTSVGFSGSYTATLAMIAGDALDVAVGYGTGGYFGDSTLIEATISPQGTTAPIGSGCGAYGNDLATTAVLIGQPTTVSLTNAAPGVTGTLYLSTVPASSWAIGNACVVYISLASYVPLFAVQTSGSGAWSGVFGVPFDPALVGLQFAMQGKLGPTASPFGFDLTNGVLVTVGQ